LIVWLFSLRKKKWERKRKRERGREKQRQRFSYLPFVPNKVPRWGIHI
jgi:hypothetical protein